MPARDLYHDCVREALVSDGWTITHDPYRIPFGLQQVYVDLGAERTLAAEKGDERIAIEIKSFIGSSPLHDFELALGHYLFYRSLIQRVEPQRKLFLAIPVEAFETTLTLPILEPPLQDFEIALLVFDPTRKAILRWMK